MNPSNSDCDIFGLKNGGGVTTLQVNDNEA